jgi:hypothetical protein
MEREIIAEKNPVQAWACRDTNAAQDALSGLAYFAAVDFFHVHSAF